MTNNAKHTPIVPTPSPRRLPSAALGPVGLALGLLAGVPVGGHAQQDTSRPALAALPGGPWRLQRLKLGADTLVGDSVFQAYQNTPECREKLARSVPEGYEGTCDLPQAERAKVDSLIALRRAADDRRPSAPR